MKWALVTGASAGIGQATAKLLWQQGYSLILTARRKERLQQFEKALKAERPHQEVVLGTFDISERTQVESFCRIQDSVLSKLEVLVNNAGLARGVEKVPEARLDDWDQMIDTNIKGLFYLTRFISEKMLKNKAGIIVNLGSVAGRWTYPGGAVYCATKHAVKAFSEGLRMDLLGTGVRVVNIEPGMVETEFSQVRLQDDAKGKAVYAGMKPLTAEDIAETILWTIQRPKHVNIQELVIFPTDQASVRDVHRNV
ncbi:MAG: SDR family NAD(P)-dependent oxidoreductase [Proteobacteria bacterium]|jgi:hypothetical protein|nr:SDR family NAD(P)-dependent oxidoreductase [Pseudomonadota bacterium]